MHCNNHLPDCDHDVDDGDDDDNDDDGDHDADDGDDDWQRKVDFMFPKLNVTLDIGRIFQ